MSLSVNDLAPHEVAAVRQFADGLEFTPRLQISALLDAYEGRGDNEAQIAEMADALGSVADDIDDADRRLKSTWELLDGQTELTPEQIRTVRRDIERARATLASAKSEAERAAL